ncbi:MAG: nitronate monooxygenase [Leptospiraceae bacterium]|nr:nitronate monooxygenase [Leptospiraceae bacterium]
MMNDLNFLQNIRLIQGGMGVYVSNWKLAKSVSLTKPGRTVGTISGTALDVVYARLLQLGDPGGHIKKAFGAFDQAFNTNIGKEIYTNYYIAGGKRPDERFKYVPRINPKPANGLPGFPIEQAGIYTLKLDEELIKLLILVGFAETWLAKQGHNGLIFINFLHKIETPLMYVLYGAMLASIDGVIVGAGNPDGLPQMCSMLANHQDVQIELNVLYKEAGEKFVLPFCPKDIDEGKLTTKPLKRPTFLAIVSLHDLAIALSKSSSLPPDGFVIENYRAGGHNANPVEGIFKKDALGQPLYGEKDIANLEVIKGLNLPYWLGGGYGNGLKLKEALETGANGVQVGSLFALCEESGMRSEHKAAIFQELKKGKDDISIVRTTMYSPTGFSFKVALLEGTLADKEVYENRNRTCDIGLLHQFGLSKPDESKMRKMFQRCPAAPVNGFIKNRGIERNTEEKRCLCNGLLAAVGLPQVAKDVNGNAMDEPSIVSLGENLQGIRELSRNGQIHYSCADVIDYITGDASSNLEDSSKNIFTLIDTNNPINKIYNLGLHSVAANEYLAKYPKKRELNISN